MTTIIQLRRGTAAEWTTANPTLALGEAGIETNTLTWKVGDGVTDWANLAYMSGGGGNVTYGNSNVAAFLASFGSNVLVTTGNITAGNVSISGVISATGNITSGAGYFVGDGSQLTNLPIGNYSNANVAAYLPTYTGNLAALTGNVITTANVTGGNVNTSGVVNASGNITGLNLNTPGVVSATGNVIGSNFNTSGQVTANGNISGANISVSGNVNGGNIKTVGLISATGNITGAYILGDGSQLSNLPSGSTGNIRFDNTYIYSVGNADIFIDPSNNAGNTSFIQVPGPANANTNPLVIENQMSGNVELTSNNNTWIFDNVGNLTLPSTNYIQTSVGSNANINLHPDGTGLVKIQGGDGDPTGVLLNLTSDAANSENRIEIDTFGGANTLGGTITGSFSRGNITSPSAVLSGDRLAAFKGKGFDGSYFTGPTGQITIDAYDDWSVGSNPTRIGFWSTNYGCTVPKLNVSVSADGNLTVLNGNINLFQGGGHLHGNAITGNGALYAGLPNFTILGTDVVAQFSGNVNAYSQINFQNISDGTQASGDFIITANNGTDSANFVNLGIAGNNWNGTQPNSLGSNVAPNDGYLYVNGGNLIVGTDTSTWKFSTSGSFVQTPVPYANLTAVAGARAFINDGNLVSAGGGSFGAQVSGGGSNICPVWSDGSNWYIG